MFKNWKIFALVLSCCSTSFLVAQTDSPYSRYGLGTLKNHTPGSLKGMGGIGYGVKKTSGVNTLNPASYAQADSLTMIFDFGVSFNSTRFKDNVGAYNKDGGGLDYVTVLFPVSKTMGISAGLIPFSTTRYSISHDASMSLNGEDINYTTVNEATGGLSQAYLGLGFKMPVKGLSLGFNVSYLFGNLKFENKVTNIRESSSSIAFYPPAEYSTLNVTTAKVDLGVQYSLKVDNKDLTFGFTYSPKINGTGSLKTITNKGSGSGETTSTREVVHAGIPDMFGFGVSYGLYDRWLVGADFGYEKWKSARFTDALEDGIPRNQRFNNRLRVAAGGEYRVAEYSRKYLEKVKYRLGFNYNNSYVNILDSNKNKQGYDQYGVTFGFGIPLLDRQSLGNRTSYLNLNFEYRKLKPKLNTMISEDFYAISLSMNVNELWFLKRKIK